MRKEFWMTTILALTLLQPGFAQFPRVTVEVRSWSPSLNGSVQAGSKNIGVAIDLEGDLDLRPNDLFEGRLIAQLSRRNRLRLSYLKGDIQGDTLASRTFSFSDQDFTLSTRVVSNLDLEIARIGWIWQIFSSRRGNIQFGPLIELKAIRGNASIAAPDVPLPLSASERFEAGSVAAGLALDLKFGKALRLFAESSDLINSGSEQLNDSEYGVRYTPIPKLEIVVGKRRLEIGVDDGSDFLLVNLEGTFFGVGLKF